MIRWPFGKRFTVFFSAAGMITGRNHPKAIGSSLDLCSKEFARRDNNFLQWSKGAWNQCGYSSQQASIVCCDRWRVRNIKAWIGLEKIGSSTRRPSGFLEADNAMPSSAEDGLCLRVCPLQRSPT